MSLLLQILAIAAAYLVQSSRSRGVTEADAAAPVPSVHSLKQTPPGAASPRRGLFAVASAGTKSSASEKPDADAKPAATTTKASADEKTSATTKASADKKTEKRRRKASADKKTSAATTEAVPTTSTVVGTVAPPVEEQEEVAEEDAAPEDEEEAEQGEGPELSENPELSEGEERVMGEEHMDKGEFGVAVMLVGCVVFVMSLFIAANMDDDDMKFYVWKVISSTISILVAILVFRWINDFMHFVILQDYAHEFHVLWDFSQCLLYITTMQVTVAACTLANDDAEVSMRCWGQLMSHAAGFASIHFGGCMQQGELEILKKHAHITKFIAAPVMAVSLWFVFVAFRFTRSYVSHTFLVDLLDARHSSKGIISRFTSTVADSKGVYLSVAQEEEAIAAEEAAEEERHVHRAESIGKWEATIYEAENDVSALCISFLTVQALRCVITGRMPDELGNEMGDTEHDAAMIKLMAGSTVVLLILTIVMEIIAVQWFTSDMLKDMAAMMTGFSWKIFFFLLGKRMSIVGAQACAMGMAWSVLCNSQWILILWYPGASDSSTIYFKVVLALTISSFAFCVTLLLDKISDRLEGTEGHLVMKDMMNRSIIKIILALGILVGFSWEFTFDRAVAVIVEIVPCPKFLMNLGGPAIMDGIGTIAISALVVYSWRRYILTKVIKYEEDREAIGKCCH